jgi:hypothetical protein
MDIEFDLAVSSDEQTRLASIIGCDVHELEARLSSYGRAAMREYVNGFLGNWTATRAADLQEYRLLALILDVFGGGIPDEDVVVRHFSITLSQARSLIRSVLSKHQFELAEPVASALAQVLENCAQQAENGEYQVVIKNTTIVEELNSRLAAIDGRLPKIDKKRGTVSVFVASPAAYEALCGSLGVTVRRFGDE